MSDSGELTDLGRSYIPPRVLLEALYVICSSASQWGDPTEAENLAMEILIITHHPSIGITLNTLSLAQTPHSQTLTVPFIFLSRSSPWSLDRSSPLHELKSWGIHREESGGHPATTAGGQCWQPGLKSTQYFVLRIYIWLIYRHFLQKVCRNQVGPVVLLMLMFYRCYLDV